MSACGRDGKRFDMRNEKKKVTFEDKFARRYYCANSKRRYTKWVKVANSRKARRIAKREIS